MELDVQYDPKQELEGSNFGGKNFNLPSARATIKAKVVDDIETLKIDNTINKFKQVNEIETGRADYRSDQREV